MPELPKDPLYEIADPKMLFRVFKPGLKPGMVALETLAVPRLTSEAALSGRIDQEAAARQTADTTEAAARTYADMQEGQARIAGDAQEKADRQAAVSSEATTRASADTALGQRVTYLEAVAVADDRFIAALQVADTSEANARIAADNAEAQTRATADTAEASARTTADTALGNRITALEGKIVPFSATLVLPGGISLIVGKSTRTVAIAGLKKNDNLVVTPNAALPANISMGEAYCLVDGTLTVVLLNTALLALSISTTQNIPLGVLALRP